MSNQIISFIINTWIFYRSGFFAFNTSLILVLFLILGSTRANAQDSDLEFGLLNVGVSSIIGGVGAVINKQPEQKFGKVLLKGFAQGALGGYVVFESKRMLREFSRTENYAYVWPSKIVNAAGNSIIENAASNQNFWEQWHLNIGFNRFDIYTKNNFRLQYRVMPFSLESAIYGFINYSFDASESLKLGTIVFRGETIEIKGNTNFNAASRDNIIFLKSSTTIPSKAHELVHTYQYEQYSGIKAYFNKVSNKLESKSKIYNFYTKYFYTDFNAPLIFLFYQTESKRADRYEDNIFEKEAYYFTY